MSQKDLKIKIGVSILLVLLLFFSVFVIVAARSNLWEKWLAKEESIQSSELITENSSWKYMDTGQEPGVGNVWTTIKYDADAWEEKQGIYKKDLTGDDLSSTAFFRYEFNVENLNNFQYMECNIRYADAVIVYLNGSIVYTGNVPSGGYLSNQDMGASNTVNTIEEATFYITDMSDLKKGLNVLAIELHRKDVDSTKLYFHLPYLRIFETKKEESVPDTKGMMLLIGDKGDELGVNWMTDSDRPYKIEYMEGTKEEVDESTFSTYSKTVIMGSKKTKYDGMFINTATLTRLKPGTDYVYRAVQIGGKEGSEIYEFHTAEKQETIFAFPGIVQFSQLTGQSSMKLWQETLQKGIDLCGKTDFLVIGKDNNLQEDTLIKNRVVGREMGFRSALESKEIPTIVACYGQSHEAKEDEQAKNHYWTYADMIFISLDVINNDYKLNRDFMEQLIKERNRKWIIVMMNTSTFQENEEMRREYGEMFQELDVDVILSGGRAYSRYYVGKEGVETEGIIKKAKGETVYITAGLFLGNMKRDAVTLNREYSKFYEEKPCIIKIKSTRFDITIETYRIEDGQKIDFCRLVKNDK